LSVVDPEHPITTGLDSFDVIDEFFYGFVEPRRSTVLSAGHHPGFSAPLASVREPGRGRSAACLIGRDMRAYDTSGFQAFFGQLVAWLLREL